MMAELGFLSETEPWRLHHRYFPSKLGGKPAWLALNNLPDQQIACCTTCNEPLVFLLQVYAPGDEPHSFHRTIFVFMCLKASCLQANGLNRCIRVFRCQLPRENSFYSNEPPKYGDLDEARDPEITTPLCRVCGSYGQKQCGACKTVYYCSKSHQLLHWRGGHKTECQQQSTTTTPVVITFGFAEHQIDIEKEEVPTTGEQDRKDIMTDYEAFIQNKRTKPTMQEEPIPANLLEKACTEFGDKVFRHFKKRISYAPDQVLRYDKGGDPLLVSAENVPTAAHIPPCNNCGAARQFEFQIMPQIINFLQPQGLLTNVVDVAKDIDFGTLLVYTCSRNCCCMPPSDAADSGNNINNNNNSGKSKSFYIEEVVWKQNLSDE